MLDIHYVLSLLFGYYWHIALIMFFISLLVGVARDEAENKKEKPDPLGKEGIAIGSILVGFAWPFLLAVFTFLAALGLLFWSSAMIVSIIQKLLRVFTSRHLPV